MQLVHVRHDASENAWAVTAHREPEWEFPLAMARLIRAPLRRPFAGEGSLFRHRCPRRRHGTDRDRASDTALRSGERDPAIPELAVGGRVQRVRGPGGPGRERVAAGGVRRDAGRCAGGDRAVTARNDEDRPSRPRENEERRDPRGSRRQSRAQGREQSEVATRAVIGTLRPTERRRAMYRTVGESTAQSPRQRIHVTNGAEGDRTPDLCSAIAALSQLSYSPALARACGEQVSASSTSQTETAPQPCGAAVTVTNLARRPALSSRRAVSAVVTADPADARSSARSGKFDLPAAVRRFIMSDPPSHDTSLSPRRPRGRPPAARRDPAHSVQLLRAPLDAKRRGGVPQVGEPAEHRIVQAAGRVQRAAHDADRGAAERRRGGVGGQSRARDRLRGANARHACARVRADHGAVGEA